LKKQKLTNKFRNTLRLQKYRNDVESQTSQIQPQSLPQARPRAITQRLRLIGQIRYNRFKCWIITKYSGYHELCDINMITIQNFET